MILEYLGGIETILPFIYGRQRIQDFRIPRRDWNILEEKISSLKLKKILEYLGGIETVSSSLPDTHQIGILEYLGGIETTPVFARIHLGFVDFRIPRRDWNCIRKQGQLLYFLILEYLGGIETIPNDHQNQWLRFDFRIPRRDWNIAK